MGVLKALVGGVWKNVGCDEGDGMLRAELPDGSWIREVCVREAATWYDSFDRADSPTLGPHWGFLSRHLDPDTLGIAGGATFAPNSWYSDWPGDTIVGYPLYVQDAATPDFDMEFTVTSIGTNPYTRTFAAFRMIPGVGDALSYWLLTDYNLIYVGPGSGGSPVFSLGTPIVGGDGVRIRVVRDHFRVWVNGVLRLDLSGYDTTGNETGVLHGLAQDFYTAGTLGYVSSRLDDFGITPIPRFGHPLKIEHPPGTWITAACMERQFSGRIWGSATGAAVSPLVDSSVFVDSSDGVRDGASYSNSFGTDRDNLGPEWLYLVPVQNYSVDMAVVDVGQADFTIEAVIEMGGSTGGDCGICFTTPDARDWLIWDYGVYYAHYWDGGDESTREHAGSGSNSGTHTVKLIKTGQRVRFYYDGALVFDVTFVYAFPADMTCVGLMSVLGSSTRYESLTVTW